MTSPARRSSRSAPPRRPDSVRAERCSPRWPGPETGWRASASPPRSARRTFSRGSTASTCEVRRQTATWWLRPSSRRTGSRCCTSGRRATPLPRPNTPKTTAAILTTRTSARISRAPGARGHGGEGRRAHLSRRLKRAEKQ